MTSWEDKDIKDLTKEDKADMIENFAGSLGEFFNAVQEQNPESCAQIATVLISAFAVALYGTKDEKELQKLISGTDRIIVDNIQAIA